MNPRKVGTPAEEANAVVPVDPLEMFLPESQQTETTQRTALLDPMELPLRRSPPPATTVSTRRRRRGRSRLRSLSAAGVGAVSIVLALIAGSAVRNPFDVSVLSDYLANARSEYGVIDRISTPTPRPVVVPDEVVRNPATTASKSGTTNSRRAIVVPRKTVIAEKKPEKVQRPSASSARSRATVSPATSRTPTVIVRREESRPSAPAVAATTASPAVPVSSGPPLPAGSSPPPVPVVSAATAVPAVTSATTVSTPTAAAPPSAPVSAPVSAPSATPAAGVTAETRGVTLALNRYQEAFSALDVGAAHAVWPGVDVRALAKAFDQLEEQTFELNACNIAVAGVQAEADCGGNARYVRKVGNRALRVEPRRWHFKLRQTNDQWVIDAVNAR